MAELLDAGIDLGAIAACYVAIGFLLLIAAVVGSILKTIDVPIGPWHPLHGLVTKAENAVTGEINSLVKGLETQATKFESGLVDAFTLIVGIPLVLAVALRDLLQYLWHSALSGFVHSITDAIASVASSAVGKVETLARTVANDLSEAKNYAETQAGAAVAAAKGYADHWIDNAVRVLHSDIASALSTAESYADTALAKLRAIEDAAVASAVGLAVEAKNAGIAAAAGALRTAEGYTDEAKGAALAAAAGALTTAESYADAAERVAASAAAGALTAAEGYADRAANAAAAGAAAALAQSEGVVTASVDAVKAIAIDVEHGLGDLEGIYGALGSAALIAAIPAIATLVHAIAADTGLENSDCRQKVKGICATPSNLWEELLGGLVAVGFAFSLVELAEVADPILVELAPVIVQAA